MRAMAEEKLSIQQAERVDHQLIRAIGVPGLTANIVNATIGAKPAEARPFRARLLRCQDSAISIIFRDRFFINDWAFSMRSRRK